MLTHLFMMMLAFIPQPEYATVDRVVDGDTIVVTLDDNTSQTVRLIGIDSPETVHPNKPIECWGPEASRAMEEYLPVGSTVALIKDQSETDQYGRLLRYVYQGSTNINDQMILSGNAISAEYKPDTKLSTTFNSSEEYAKRNNLGLWKFC